MIVTADERLHVEGFADAAGSQNLAHRDVVRIPTAALVNGQREIARRRRVDHAVSLVDADGEWFLADHVLARVQSGEHGIQMRAGWGADHDQAYIRVSEHLLLSRMP